jgi:hypothetical protein
VIQIPSTSRARVCVFAGVTQLTSRTFRSAEHKRRAPERNDHGAPDAHRPPSCWCDRHFVPDTPPGWIYLLRGSHLATQELVGT